MNEMYWKISTFVVNCSERYSQHPSQCTSTYCSWVHGSSREVFGEKANGLWLSIGPFLRYFSFLLRTLTVSYLLNVFSWSPSYVQNLKEIVPQTLGHLLQQWIKVCQYNFLLIERFLWNRQKLHLTKYQS